MANDEPTSGPIQEALPVPVEQLMEEIRNRLDDARKLSKYFADLLQNVQAGDPLTVWMACSMVGIMLIEQTCTEPMFGMRFHGQVMGVMYNMVKLGEQVIANAKEATQKGDVN